VQRKTVDGVIIGWGGVRSFKLQQVAPYHVDISVGTSISMIFMPKKKFQSLPAAAQKILLDTSGEPLSRGHPRRGDGGARPENGDRAAGSLRQMADEDRARGRCLGR